MAPADGFPGGLKLRLDADPSAGDGASPTGRGMLGIPEGGIKPQAPILDGNKYEARGSLRPGPRPPSVMLRVMRMRLAIVTFLLLWTPLGCRTEELDVATAETRKAELRNIESKAEHFRRRTEWAKAKESEYRILVTEAEEKLAEIRGQLLQLRQDNNRRAAEVAKLVNEGKVLDADMAKRRQDITAKKALIQKLTQEGKDLEKSRRETEARLAELKAALLRVTEENRAALERTKAFFQSMGWEFPKLPGPAPEKPPAKNAPPKKAPVKAGPVKTPPAKANPTKTTPASKKK